jgi:hypothetical protein
MYRLKQLDPLHDIHILQKRFLLFFWWDVTAGSKSTIEKFIEEQNKNV